MGRARSVGVVVAAVLLSGAVIAWAPGPTTGSEAGSNLPDSAESARAAAALRDLPGAETQPAVVVFSRDGEELSAADVEAASAVGRSLGELVKSEVPPPVVSENGKVGLLTVPVESGLTSDENGELVDRIREVAADGVPTGLRTEVTGPPAIFADLGAVFSGADTRLLLVTAAVVALLLLITYRSPWLWLVPLSVVGVADRVAARVVDAASHWSGIAIDGSVTGITSVLVFGAGTNYALLLIARYREELRREDDRREAMRVAVGQAAPAILSSSGTVVIALAALSLADSPFVSAIGLAGAVGIAVAVAFALVVLPSAMVLPGRWLFWPFVPRSGDPSAESSGWWYRLGVRVTARPRAVLALGLAALAVMCLGALGLKTGLSQDEQFLDTPESIRAQSTLTAGFPAGLSAPVRTATTPDRVDEITEVATGVEGVATVLGSSVGTGVAEVTLSLAADPGDTANRAAVERLRTALDEVDRDALVGGVDAEMLDERTTADRDQRLLVPLVLLIVLGMLLFLLRSVVAAICLTSATVLSYVAALGVGWFVFERLGWSAMDVSTPLLAFLFLVALGVDYNIFLTARAREEMRTSGDPVGSIVTALAVTGGVITSAGILLAAVFAVLGVLPLVLLAQLGIIVGFGVLLDTLVVRSLVTPAMVAVLGTRFWSLRARRPEPAA